MITDDLLSLKDSSSLPPTLTTMCTLGKKMNNDVKDQRLQLIKTRICSQCHQ